jgi:hypothetical protein
MKAEHAVAIGQEALIWLAGQEEAMAAFLGASGLAPADLRARAAEPEFLGFVLDHVLAADAWVLAFAAAAGLRPEDPLRARAALAGGELPHWT